MERSGRLRVGGDYTGKPRPVVSERWPLGESAPWQGTQRCSRMGATWSRNRRSGSAAPAASGPIVEPDVLNGLEAPSRLMVDKITTVRRGRLGSRVGRLSDEDLVKLNRAILVFLGFASRPRSGDES